MGSPTLPTLNPTSDTLVKRGRAAWETEVLPCLGTWELKSMLLASLGCRVGFINRVQGLGFRV